MDVEVAVGRRRVNRRWNWHRSRRRSSRGLRRRRLVPASAQRQNWPAAQKAGLQRSDGRQARWQECAL